MADNDDDSRLDRELIELLNELRVALPGVQVLFAFLLIVPFSKGFPQLSQSEQMVYLAAVLCTMLSTVLFVAPTTYHRIRFRDHDKEQLIYTANRLVLAGTAFLAAAMCCAVYLVSEYVFNLWVGIATTAVTALSFAFFWYALPLSREAARKR